MTRVLTVLPAMPLPATAGLQLRMVEELQIVRGLGCHSTVLAFQTEDDDPGAERLSTLCDEAITGGQRVPYHVFSAAERARQRLQFVYNALRHRRGDIYPLSVRYDRMGAKEVVADAIARTKPDFVILPSFLSHYAPVVARAGCGTVIDAADVLSDLTRAFVRAYGARNPLKIPGLVANHLAARSQERLFLPDVDEIWCTWEPEAARLAAISGNPHVIVVPNAIPASSISPPRLPDRPIVGFIGTYAYTPTLDAAIVLVDDVLPLLRVLAPDVRVRLAGTGMPAGIEQRLSLTPNVQVMGPVGDAAGFVAGCRVMALPIRRPGGVPFKLIEAMAAQRPVVATSALVTGLESPIGQALLIADSPRELADAIQLVLSDTELATRLASTARRTFERDLSIEAVLARLTASSVLAGSPHAGE